MDIKEIRVALSMKQGEFGRWLKVSAGCVSRWESGERNVSESTIDHIKSKLLLLKIQSLGECLLEFVLEGSLDKVVQSIDLKAESDKERLND